MTNKDMKSTANMTLKGLAQELPRLQAEARALWGEAYPFTSGYAAATGNAIPSWQYHLQRMVVAPDPTDYLGENT